MRSGCTGQAMRDILQDEREKYERMWDISRYRSYSPGEKALPTAVRYLKTGSTVADFGCGTGRAAQSLQNAGYHVTAIDFAGNCLDGKVDVPFHRACLWELPPDMLFDYGYCTDVMEHIPTSKVNATLKCLHGATRFGCFFQIATFKDRFGDLIGERLHLTVQSADTWGNSLSKFWPHVEMISGKRDAQFWVSH